MLPPASVAAWATLAAGVLGLTACAVDLSPDEATSANLSACHGAYVADVDTSVAGEATPGAAAVAWAQSVLAPSGVPAKGWKEVDERTLRSGDWTVGVTRTQSRGWLVDGLGCGPVPS